MQNSGKMINCKCIICGRIDSRPVETQWGLCPPCTAGLLAVINDLDTVPVPECVLEAIDNWKE